MKNLLRDHLTPDDDGRAFTDAVLFRAAGALHRRGAARGDRSAPEAPVLAWLERWARPWVIAALAAVAVAALMPSLRPEVAPSGTHALSADAVTALLPEDVAATALTEY